MRKIFLVLVCVSFLWYAIYRGYAAWSTLLPDERSPYFVDAMAYSAAGIATAALCAYWVWPRIFPGWVYVPLHVPRTGKGGCADGNHHVVIMSESEIKTVLDTNRIQSLAQSGSTDGMSSAHNDLFDHFHSLLPNSSSMETRQLLRECAQKYLPGDLSRVPCFATNLDLKDLHLARLARNGPPSTPSSNPLPVGSEPWLRRKAMCKETRERGREYAAAVRANFKIQDDLAEAQTALLSAIDDRDNKGTAHLSHKVLLLGRHHERTLAQAQKILHGKSGVDPEATDVPPETLLAAAAECTDPGWWKTPKAGGHITGNKREIRAARRTGTNANAQAAEAAIRRRRARH